MVDCDQHRRCVAAGPRGARAQYPFENGMLSGWYFHSRTVVGSAVGTPEEGLASCKTKLD